MRWRSAAAARAMRCWQATHAKSLIGRMGTEEEIAAAIVFLCSAAGLQRGRGGLDRGRRLHARRSSERRPRRRLSSSPGGRRPLHDPPLRSCPSCPHPRRRATGWRWWCRRAFRCATSRASSRRSAPGSSAPCAGCASPRASSRRARLEDGGELPYLGERLALARPPRASVAPGSPPRGSRRDGGCDVMLPLGGDLARRSRGAGFAGRRGRRSPARLDAAVGAGRHELHHASDPRPAHALGQLLPSPAR